VSDSSTRSATRIAAQDIDLAIFDLDGVLTRTADVHAAAWKRLFDDFLRARDGAAFRPFDATRDYLDFVDGMPRYDGVRAFLASRGIVLPDGEPTDRPGMDTVCALGNTKNRFFLEALERQGVAPFDDAVDLVDRLRAAGIATAVVSASENCAAILERAGIAGLFDLRVDGVDIARVGLKGKPAPDTFLEAARRLNLSPDRAVVFEDALAGVAAGRAGGFALVVGVDRIGQAAALIDNGADVACDDLRRIVVDPDTRQASGGAHEKSRSAQMAKPGEWSLIYDHFDPAAEPLREALCTLGNGYVATRGAAQEAVADEVHYPGTYLAGGYNRLRTSIGGQTVENEDLVNFPNWLLLGFRAGGGDWFNLLAADILEFRQELDLRHGLLLRRVRFRDRQGRVTVLDSRRLVHMANPHIGAIRMTVLAENWSGTATVRSAIDGRVINAGVARYRQLNATHLETPEQGGGDDTPVWLLSRTSQSRLEMALASRTDLYIDGAPLACPRARVDTPGLIGEDLALPLEAGQTLSVEKMVALHSSRDRAISECLVEAREAVAVAPRFEVLEQSHRQAWRSLWARADISVTDHNGGHATLLLRLHAFHLLQTVSLNSVDLDVSVPARGLHGEAYRGHIFWDELFIFPFYNYRFPEIARALLRYRFRRLDMARRLAHDAGYRGAMFPWQSGSDGREESQRVHLNPKSGRWLPDHTHLQRHVNAAVAYNAWQYFQASSDLQFLESTGAELILEIARFWSSIASLDAAGERYEIRGVVGPDEYHVAYPGSDHPGIDNNAYTNVMAAWTLTTALTVLELLPRGRRDELCDRLALRDDELGLWHEISRCLVVPFHGDGIISQFQGYAELREFDWDGYRAKYGDIQRLDRILEAEGDDPNRYKLSKQADVLMLFYLFSAERLTALLHQLGYAFDPASIPRIIDYYLRRTSHGSTLSQVVHAWVLARSDRPRAWARFLQALESDVADVQGGTTAEGIHLGAMAATIDLVQRCFSGLELRDRRLWLHPRLPDEVRDLRFTVRYHNNWFDVDIGGDRLRLTANRRTRQPVEVWIESAPRILAPGETLEQPLSSRPPA